MPKRIQRSRTKYWRMPEGAIYVGRGSTWGNPFSVGFGKEWHPDGSAWCMTAKPVSEEKAREFVLDLYRKWIAGNLEPGWCDDVAPTDLTELRGEAANEIERLQKLLDHRDDFIVDNALWGAYVVSTK